VLTSRISEADDIFDNISCRYIYMEIANNSVDVSTSSNGRSQLLAYPNEVSANVAVGPHIGKGFDRRYQRLELGNSGAVPLRICIAQPVRSNNHSQRREEALSQLITLLETCMAIPTSEFATSHLTLCGSLQSDPAAQPQALQP
jgi:hypothetical protein